VLETPDRWWSSDANTIAKQVTVDQHDYTMLRLQKKFAKRRYLINIYELNKRALQIQHWFFKRRAARNMDAHKIPV
jgi:hypothetical protein